MLFRSDRIMVRARVRDHLVNLMEAFPILAAEIEEHTGTDYAYRLHTDKRNWAKVVASLAEDIDYNNFKGEVAREVLRSGKEPDKRPRLDATYEDALHDVWGTMHCLEPEFSQNLGSQRR